MGRSIGPDQHAQGAIYVDEVVHKRVRPRRHALRYRVFSILVDLDQLEALNPRLRFFSLNRFNIVSLVTRDFGPRDGANIAAFIRAKAAAAGGGEIACIRMLAYSRLLGFAFNPIMIYFCDDATGATWFLAYEVSNTFGKHHFILLLSISQVPKFITRSRRRSLSPRLIRLRAISVSPSGHRSNKSLSVSPCRPWRSAY
ncbi:MAG: DUF1365 family protein [Candidatus Devosia symbiotica]|nr:DUF1365 family protein [Candidatus Devosia symbiotica]